MVVAVLEHLRVSTRRTPLHTFVITLDDTFGSGIGMSVSPISSIICLISRDRSATSRSTVKCSLSDVVSNTIALRHRQCSARAAVADYVT